MMRKILAVCAAMVMALCLFGCGDNGSQAGNKADTNHLEIVGAYYGDLGTDSQLDDLYVVFDYYNDSTNRQLPDDANEVTASINEKNVYTATPNQNHQILSTGLGEYQYKDFDYAERYTGYRYPVGYGEILGGSEPVRMFATFLFNPNDLKDGKTITLTVGDLTAEYPVSDAVEITMSDQILLAEGTDFENTQMLAAAKWRIDCAAAVIKDLDHLIANNHGRMGEDLSGISDSLKNMFSAKSGGLSIFEEPSEGYKSSTSTYYTVVADLPSYNHDAVIAANPDAAKLINKFEKQVDKLANAIVKPSTKGKTAEKMINDALKTYREICDVWGVDPIKNV